MQRPDSLDSRLILRGYAVATVFAGLAVVGYRWPAPATLTIDRLTVPELWSLMLVSAGNLIWVSGAVAWACARIEHPADRLRQGDATPRRSLRGRFRRGRSSRG